MTTITSKALKHFIISSACEGNIEAISAVACQLSKNQKNAIANILEMTLGRPLAATEKASLQTKVIKVLISNSPFYRILDPFPVITSYLTEKDLASAAGTDSFFLEQVAPHYYGQLTARTFTLVDLRAHPKPAREAAAIGCLARLNLKANNLGVALRPQKFSLPVAVLSEVFSYLDWKENLVIARTCLLFQKTSYASLLDLTGKTVVSFKQLKFYKTLFGLSSLLQVMQFNSRRAKMITRLGKREDSGQENFLQNFETLAPFCTNLRRLFFPSSNSFIPPTKETIRILSQFCPHLSEIYIRKGNLEPGFLSLVGDCFPDLQSLKLAESVVSSEADLVQLIQKCRKLKNVDIGRNVDRRHYITNETLNALAENCQALETLRLGLRQPTRPSNEEVFSFLQKTPQIQNLFIEKDYFSNFFLDDLRKAAPQLKKLSLVDKNKFESDINFISLLKGYPHLEELETYIASTAVYAAQDSHNLKRLRVLNNKFSWNSGVPAVILSIIQNAKAFQTLELNSNSYVADEYLSFKPLARELIKRRIRIKGANRIPDSFVALQREFSYQPQTTLGKLYRAALFEEVSSAEMKDLLSCIHETLRDTIFGYLWENANRPLEAWGSVWGKKHALDDLSQLSKAILDSVNFCCNMLSLPKKNLVHANIYHLAGSPATSDTEWGKTFQDHLMTRFVDAFAMVMSEA